MLPWKNSWFQIAFFTLLFSGALLVVDYVPAQIFFMLARHQLTVKNGVNYDADAAPLMQKACQWGSAKACEILAIDYDNGEYGIAQDWPKSAALLQKACDAGRAFDCDALAFDYMAGKGVVQDPKRAVAIWQKLCDAGATRDADPPCQRLASASEPGAANFAKGEVADGQNDHARALQSFQEAAAQGNADAENRLGMMYEIGSGVQRNYAVAMKWYQKAAAQGSEPAKQALAKLQYSQMPH